MNLDKWKAEFEKKFNVNVSEDFDEIPAYSMDVWNFIENMAKEIESETATGCMKIAREEDGGGEVKFVKTLGNRIVDRIAETYLQSNKLRESED